MVCWSESITKAGEAPVDVIWWGLEYGEGHGKIIVSYPLFRIKTLFFVSSLHRHLKFVVSYKEKVLGSTLGATWR